MGSFAGRFSFSLLLIGDGPKGRLSPADGCSYKLTERVKKNGALVKGREFSLKK
jgi:hypothetical protein